VNALVPAGFPPLAAPDPAEPAVAAVPEPHPGDGPGDAPDPLDGPTDPAEVRMYEALREHDPRLADAFAGHLPRARSVTLGRLVEALWREDAAGFRSRGRTFDAGRCGGGLARVRPGAWAVSDLPGGGAVAFPVLAEHAFGRVDAGCPVLHLPPPSGAAEGAGRARVLTRSADLLALLSEVDGTTWSGLAVELADGTANLALALARRDAAATAARRRAAASGAADCLELAHLVAAESTGPVPGLPPEPTVFLEKLSTGGHNLHPCARTRLGMDPGDLLRHDVESASPTEVTLVAVRREHAESTPDTGGRDVGEVLVQAYPRLAEAVAAAGVDRRTHLLLPVHAWQLERVVRVRYAAQVGSGDVVPVPGARLLAEPTVSLRTLLTEPAPDGRRFFVKTALDVQVTSTRRTISAHTATNGPVFSALLERIVAGDPTLARRVVLLPELAGASYRGERSLSAVVRADLSGRLRPGEVAVPGVALYARSPLSGRTVLAELVDRYAAHQREPCPELAALSFLDRYARVLLGAVLRLMAGYGVGLEAHLQNTLPTFVDGVPARVVFRDWGGLRVHLPRLARRGYSPALRPGSLTATGSVDVLRAKVVSTSLQSHLGEVVVQLGRSHGLAEAAAWARVRAAVVGVLTGLAREAAGGAEPETARVAADAADDLRALLAPTLPHKALVSMRLHPDGGDRHVAVPNPLWAEGPA
jgi:D-ornithine---citrate ligase